MLDISIHSFNYSSVITLKNQYTGYKFMDENYLNISKTLYNAYKFIIIII